MHYTIDISIHPPRSERTKFLDQKINLTMVFFFLEGLNGRPFPNSPDLTLLQVLYERLHDVGRLENDVWLVPEQLPKRYPELFTHATVEHKVQGCI